MQTKSEMINRIAELANEVEQRKHEYEVLDAYLELAQGKIAELKAENDKLKEEIKEVKKYQYQQEYLDKEIEEMQKALKTLGEGLNKRQMILQKIKAIAEENQFYFRPGTIVSYETIKQLATSFEQILDLITKAEEE